MTATTGASEQDPAVSDVESFRVIAERAGDCFFRLRLTPTLAFEYLGDVILRHGGFPADAFVADPGLVMRQVEPADRAVLEAILSPHGSEDIDQELHWRHRDGRLVWSHVWARRRTRPDGSVVLDGLVRDLTTLRVAQAAVEADRQMYRTLTETMKDVVWVLDLESLRYVYVSPSIHGLRGFTAEEVLAAPFEAGFDEGALAEVRQRLADDTTAVLAGRQPLDTFASMQVRQLRRDGSTVWTEVTGRYHRDEQSGRLQIWGVTRDITQHRAALAAVADSERRYRLVAENASDVVVLRDQAGIITWASPSVHAVLGWEQADLLGHDTLDFTHPDDVEQIHHLRADVASGATPSGLVTRIRQADGGYRYMSVWSRAVPGNEGNPMAAVVGMRDVDEVVRQRQRAERSERLLRAVADARLAAQTVLEPIRDAEGQVVDFGHLQVNRAACEAVGMSREELQTATLREVVPDTVTSGLLAALVETLETGEPLLLDDLPLTWPREGGARRLDVSAARVGDWLVVDWIDSTDRSLATRRLADSERRYRLLAENTMDVIVHYRDGAVAWVSPALTETLGWLPSQWVGAPIGSFLHPDDVGPHARSLPVLLAGDPVIARYRLRDADGDYHWVETHAKPFRDDDGQEDGVVASFRTIDVEVRAEEELERRARFDDLTGTLKRDEAITRLSRHGDRRRPDAGRAVLFIDVDGFKQINDTYGHRAGDAILRTLAGRITDLVRDGDPVARMGGDEFLVILEAVGDREHATAIAEKIRMAATEPIAVAADVLLVTVSVGVTLAGPHETPDDVVARADDAMYAAKDAGRDRVVYLDSPGAYASE